MNKDRHIRVVLVEDDPASRANTQLLLELEGFAVAAADDGVAGLALIERHTPDVVVCDIMMPRLDGIALLAEVRARPALTRLPFIFLTGLADRTSQRNGMNGGADDYLTKPFAPEELFAAIEARVRRAAAYAPAGPATAARQEEIAALLSPRELEILLLIGRGTSSRDIAARLGISLRTVDSHRAKIIAKLELDGAYGLVRLAARYCGATGQE
jgi:DNA-binding NarL/FixJ family response regulator